MRLLISALAFLLLAARWGVPPDRFAPAEALLESDELAARFGGKLPGTTVAINLADVGREKPRTRL